MQRIIDVIVLKVIKIFLLYKNSVVLIQKIYDCNNLR